MHNPQIAIAEITSKDDLDQITKAREIAETLVQHYPQHLWAVSWQGGVIVVKNLAVSGHYGFVIKPRDSYSASDLAKQAVRAGGELLERAGMRRGAWNGQFAERTEGVK